MDERPEMPDVLPPSLRDDNVVGDRPDGDFDVPAGDGNLPVSRDGELSSEREQHRLDRTEEIQAWSRSAEGLIFAYWHDPRTAIKYAVGVLRAMQTETMDEWLAIDPQSIPPITEREAGWA